MKKVILPLLMVLSAPVASAGFMDEEELLSIYGDESFVSIATGSAQHLARAPAVASIVTQDDIKRAGIRDLDEALQTIPGLHVSRDVIGHNPLYIFRGIHADFNPQVLMLVDGVPLTNLFHGDRGQFWGGMPVESISRIEVIRGPGSSLYGADAFAGVIKIITKSPSDISEKGESGIRVGNFNRREGWFSGRSDMGDLQLALTMELGMEDVKHGRIDRDIQSVLDEVTGTSASLAPGNDTLDLDRFDLRLTGLYKDHWRFNLGHQYRSGEGTLGVSGALVTDNHFRSNRSSALLRYANETFSANWGLSASLSYLHATVETVGDVMLLPPGSASRFDVNDEPIGVYTEGLFGNPETFEHHWRADVSGTYSGFVGHQLTVGGGYYFGDLYKTKESKNYGIDPETGEHIASIGTDPQTGLPIYGRRMVDVSGTPWVFLQPGTRRNYYAYIQDVWGLARGWELTAGLRYDHYSDFGSTVNPRLALVWATTRDLTTKFLYGEAFRAPSFAQTRAINNPAVLGNPNLSPETLRSYEVAFDYRPTPALNVLFNIFYYRWDEIINFVPDANDLTRTARNDGEQEGKGLEFETRWKPEQSLTLTSGFSWVRAEDKRTGSRAVNFPEQQLLLGVHWQAAPDLSFNVQATHIMNRQRLSTDPRKAPDDYTMVDLALRKQFTPAIEAAILVKNLFNEHAREPTLLSEPAPRISGDLPLPGRSLLGELRFSF